MPSGVKVGLGLIGIGREWGQVNTEVPTAEHVMDLLMAAVSKGIDFFDTAPAYGLSEERLGNFLRSLSPSETKGLTICTKFGEHWDFHKECSFVDHSFKTLCNSIDQSLRRLGKIDILQVHKANKDVLTSKDLFKAIDYASRKGINAFGASVSDVESGVIASNSSTFSWIQLPYNSCNSTMKPVIDSCNNNHKYVIINRPLNMGKLLFNSASGDKVSTMTECFNFIVNAKFQGVILTGTKSIKHLKENMVAYLASCGSPNAVVRD